MFLLILQKTAHNWKIIMKLEIYLVLFVAIFSCTNAEDEKKKDKAKKLQIGVKKRVDNCLVRSRRGDLLHMHYTVSLSFLFSFILILALQ